MLVQVRVRIPDHPGSLGSVAREIGEAGADIVQVVVLEHDGDHAVDDFTVSCPNSEVRDRLAGVLAAIPDVQVEAIWPTLSSPGTAPDVELLAQIAADPASGAKILVDAVPELLNGDWAVLLDLSAGGAGGADPASRANGAAATAAVAGASRTAPAVIDPALIETARSHAVSLAEGTRVAVTPVGRADLVLVLVRGEAPPFHPMEISRLAMLAHVTATLGAG